MSSLARSRPAAIGAVVASAATLGYMYVAGMQTKKEEGHASIYKQSTGLGSNKSDARMDSAAVRSAVQGERKP